MNPKQKHQYQRYIIGAGLVALVVGAVVYYAIRMGAYLT